MKINNKNFQDWTEEDLKVLLHNDAYRENNFIDYKVDFAPFKSTVYKGLHRVTV